MLKKRTASSGLYSSFSSISIKRSISISVKSSFETSIIVSIILLFTFRTSSKKIVFSCFFSSFRATLASLTKRI